jgi:hypothetical protein
MARPDALRKILKKSSVLGHFCDILDLEALEIHQGILNCACKFEKMS